MRQDYDFWRLGVAPQVQHGMGPLIYMHRSVFLPLWDNYELYGREILHIESFSAVESENLEFRQNSSYESSTYAQLLSMIN